MNTRLRVVSIFGFTMVIVIIPFCLYYLYYVTSQSAYLSKRSLRALEAIGGHISAKVDSLGNNLVNVAKGARQAKRDEKRADQDAVDSASKLVPDFKSKSVKYERDQHASEQPVTLDVKEAQGLYRLYLEYRSASELLPGTYSVSKDLKPIFEPFVARYLSDELNETRGGLFDAVLVAEQDTSRVIFEQVPSGLSVQTLDSLSNIKGEKADLKLANEPSSLEEVRIAGADYRLFLQPIRLTLSASADAKRQGVRWVVCGLTRTDHFRAQTFAVPYTLLTFFMFAVLLAALTWPLLKLKLMGPKDRLRNVDLGLTLCSALLGTALVTFILWDIHTYFSLKNTLDIQLSNLSANIKSNFQKELGYALSQLNQLNNTVLNAPDLSCTKPDALRQLKNSRQPPNATGRAGNVGGMAPASPGADARCDPETLSRCRFIHLLDGPIWLKTAPYPYFNNATWTDGCGEQRIKWTPRSDTTAFVNVSSRQFFTDVREGKTWHLRRDSHVFEYTFQAINSRNTGQNIAVIATKVPGSQWVSNLDTRLISLVETVLPPGYGYAVIDDGGLVQFHSDEVRSLGENFFAECDNDHWLRAAVLSRTDTPLDTDYMGVGHRMFASPLRGTSWTLVTFVDKRMARTLNLQVITLSIVLYLVFVGLILLLGLILGFPLMIAVYSGRLSRGEGFKRSWLWPDSEHKDRYNLLIPWYLVIACVFVLLLWMGDTGWLLVGGTLALPLLGVALWWLIVVKEPFPWRKRETQRESAPSTGGLSYRTGYAIACAGLLSLVSVLPASAFFLIAHNFELRLLIKHGQVSLAGALEERKQRVELRYSSVKIGGPPQQAYDGRRNLKADRHTRNAFLKQRLDPSGDYDLDVYDKFFFGTKRVERPDGDSRQETPAWVEDLILWFRPFYNQKCVETQGLVSGESSDKRWHWELGNDRQLFLQKEREGRPGERSVILASAIPDVLAVSTPWSWLRAFAAIAFVVLLPYVLVRFVARRFFLLDMDLPAPAGRPCGRGLAGSYILLRPPVEAAANGWNAETSVINLRKVEDWPAWAKEVTSMPLEPGSSVVLDHFEHGMDDPAASCQKAMTIEHLLVSGSRVVVASTCNPLSFPLAPNGQGAGISGNGKSVVSQPFSASAEASQGDDAAAKLGASVCVASQSDIQLRWTSLFDTLATVYEGGVTDTNAEKFLNKHSEFARILKTNAPWRYIDVISREDSIVQKMRGASSGWNRAMSEELIGEVVERAQPYHQALWNTLSLGRRCTLIQLAQDGMLSPKNKHLRWLAKRGLIWRDPVLRFMDESFRRFVISISHGHNIEGWRQQEGGSAWQLMWAPMLLILVAIGLFLFITQKDVFDSTITFLSALTVGIGTLFKFLGLFQRGKSGAGDLQ